MNTKFTFIFIFAFTFVTSSFYLCSPFSYAQTHDNSKNINNSNSKGSGRGIKKQNDKKQESGQAVIKSDQSPDIIDSKKAITETDKDIKTDKNKSENIKNNIKTNKDIKSETEKKKLKKAAHILEAVISGLMNILVGSFICVIGLIILKWFFLERRVDK